MSMKGSPMPDEAKVTQMYAAVLDHLLTPPQIKDQLMASQSLEKKWQTVQLHDNIFDGSGASHGGWGNKEIALLASIEKAKTPDISSLGSLKLSLQAANKEFMDSFLASGGVSVLLKAMETRLSKRPITELDIAILYEIMTCCKVIMNNAVGMEGFMAVKGAVDTIARCLRFEYRVFALLVLEILTVCCYYSDTAASLVAGGMRLLARSQNEAPFACLAKAVVQQDIEIKSAVMQFVNRMIIGVSDSNAHALLRSDLNSVLLGESFDQAVAQVDSEMELVAKIEAEAQELGDASAFWESGKGPSAKAPATGSPVQPSKPLRGKLSRLSVSMMGMGGASVSAPSSTLARSSSIAAVQSPGTDAPVDRAAVVRRASMLKSKSIKSLHGPRAISEQRVEAMLRNPNVLASISERDTALEADNDVELEVKIGGRMERILVNPLMGSMMGQLTASKNTDKMEAKLVDLWGGKKTKRRWYEVDSENFKWCSGHEKEYEYKGSIPVGTITEIRNHTTDQNLLASNPHSFEIETPERVFALGCETAAEKENWVTALQVSRDSSVMSKGSYKSHHRELTTKDLQKYAAMFKKQGMVYQSIAIEDRRAALSHNGIDMSDARAVGEFLRYEAMAAGHSDMLLGIMQELLVIPQGSRSIWEAVYAGTKVLCEGKAVDAESGEDAFHASSVVALLNAKSKDGGASYSQMSKLALAAMESDQEAQRLRAQVQQLQEQIAQLNQELQDAPAGKYQARGSVIGVVNPILARGGGASSAQTAHAETSDEAPARPSKPPKAPPVSQEAPPVPSTPPPVPVDAPEAPPASPTPARRVPPGPPPSAPAPAPAESAPAVAAAATESVPDERYAKYVKMQKMLPEGAVRQKMTADGFTPGEIDSFFTNGPPAAGVASLAPASAPAADPERYGKYVKMQKMLPEGAVRQKMSVDGFTPAEIDDFFAHGPPVAAAAAPAPPATAPAQAEPVPDERYAKYVKMQKMLPEGAVRQKMTADGFTAGEVDNFFTNGPPMVATAPAAPASAPASAEPDERYTKYVKMQKMLPEGAVRQKMTADGFTPAEIDGFFTNGPPMVGGAAPAPPAPPAAPAAPAAAPVFGERYTKYIKMKSMLPEGAVRQKMTVDGFTPSEIDVFFGVAPAAGAAAAAPKAPSFTPLEAIRFAKYEKMMKMLPEGAVRQKMVSEEMSPEDIERFFAVMSAQAAAKAAGGSAAPAAPAAPKPPAIEPPPEGMAPKPKIVPGAKLKGLFWTKLKNSEIKGTVWHKMPEYKLPPAEIKRLEELFGNKAAAADAAAAEEKAAKAAAAKEKGAKKLTSVMDSQRTQNVMIIMGKVRKNAEQIMHLILDLDPETLNQELTHTLFEVLPTTEEVEAIKPYKDPAVLDNASQLLFHFNRLPRILQRMECHEIAFSWGSGASAAASQLGVLECACQEMGRSQENLQLLLSMVLGVGNYLNGGTSRGEAYGVGLDIFAKFANLKATSQNESLMHFLARQAELHSPSLLELSNKWVAIWAAADVSYKQISADVLNLDTLVNKMNAEFTRIKDSKDNIGLDGKMEDCKGPAMNPLHRRLNTFLLVAKPRIASIRTQMKNVEGALQKEMAKYGESMKDGEGDACKTFFTTIANFARSFHAAADENTAKRLAAEKAASAQSQKESKAAAAAGVGAAGAGGSGAPTPSGPAAKAKTENIFGMFHSAQEASSDDVIAEFKLKMAKRMAKNSA